MLPKTAFMLASAALALAANDVAWAQTSDAAGPAGLDEIVVTARKRAENLQDTPIAITALTGEALERRDLSRITEIDRYTPSLVLNGTAPLSGNPSTAVVFLRGIGQIDFTINTDPGVGIYVDGVYVARSAGSVLDLVDVERVEVLRGPQGTLFGRNTIGGAISLVSKRPADEIGGRMSATYGTDNRVQLQGSLDLPISDTLLTKFTGFYHKRDGYVRQDLTGRRLGNDDALAGRAQLLWQPSSSFEALVAVDATRRRETSAPNVAIALDGTAFPLAFLENARVIGLPICASDPNSSRECFGSAWETGQPYHTNGTQVFDANLDVFGTSLTLNFTGDLVSAKSITAYREIDSTFGRDTDHTPFPYLYSSNEQHQHQWSQEFQFTGKLLNDRLNWVLGVYYFDEKASDIYVSAGSVNGVRGLNFVHNSNYAGFGELTFDVTPELHLTGGLRYTHETKRFRTDQAVIAGIRQPIGTPIVPTGTRARRTFKETNPRVILSYDVSRDLMTYLTYSRGFKSGGFNARYSSPVTALVPYAPEFATLYEAGAKFETSDRRLRLNGAIFRTDYSDVQVDFSYPGVLGTLTGNAAKARIEGVEAELGLVPVQDLTIDATASYLDARYTEVDATVPGLAVGNRLPLAPKWSFSLSASYRIPLANGGAILPQADWSYRGRIHYDSLNTAIISQRGYHLLNASIAYETPGDRLRLSAGVKNLTDKQYLTSAGYSDAAGVAEGVYARPRQWYVSAGYRF